MRQFRPWHRGHEQDKTHTKTDAGRRRASVPRQEVENLSLAPALHVQTDPLVVANAPHSLSCGCALPLHGAGRTESGPVRAIRQCAGSAGAAALTLDWARFDAPLGRNQKTINLRHGADGGGTDWRARTHRDPPAEQGRSFCSSARPSCKPSMKRRVRQPLTTLPRHVRRAAAQPECPPASGRTAPGETPVTRLKARLKAASER